jgi:hypothetical protein
MTFPDATAMASAATAITDAYDAFPFLALVFAVVAVYKLAPIGIKLFRRIIPG